MSKRKKEDPRKAIAKAPAAGIPIEGSNDVPAQPLENTKPSKYERKIARMTRAQDAGSVLANSFSVDRVNELLGDAKLLERELRRYGGKNYKAVRNFLEALEGLVYKKHRNRLIAGVQELGKRKARLTFKHQKKGKNEAPK